MPNRWTPTASLAEAAVSQVPQSLCQEITPGDAAENIFNLSSQLESHALAGLMEIFIQVKEAEEQIKSARANVVEQKSDAVERRQCARDSHPTQILPSPPSLRDAQIAVDEAEGSYRQLVELYISYRAKCIRLGVTEETIMKAALEAMHENYTTDVNNVPPNIPRVEPFVDDAFSVKLASHAMDAVEHGLVATKLVTVQTAVAEDNQLVMAASALP